MLGAGSTAHQCKPRGNTAAEDLRVPRRRAERRQQSLRGAPDPHRVPKASCGGRRPFGLWLRLLHSRRNPRTRLYLPLRMLTFSVLPRTVRNPCSCQLSRGWRPAWVLDCERRGPSDAAEAGGVVSSTRRTHRFDPYRRAAAWRDESSSESWSAAPFRTNSRA
jgi:hypothetical protein